MDRKPSSDAKGGNLTAKAKSGSASAMTRLVRALSQQGAYATHSPLGSSSFDIFSRRNDVSLRTGSAATDDVK